jgi:hypothetical protein
VSGYDELTADQLVARFKAITSTAARLEMAKRLWSRGAMSTSLYLDYNEGTQAREIRIDLYYLPFKFQLGLIRFALFLLSVCSKRIALNLERKSQ